MRKFWMYTIPLLTLAGFLLLMNGGNYLKKPLSTEDNVPYYIQQVKTAIEKEDWETAHQQTGNLNRAWEKVKPRIQFSVEKDEMNAINASLARLKGYLTAQDRSGALAEIYVIREHWDRLNE